jgi:NAD(P)H-quinone oxidoreductase subunit 4
MLSSLLLVPLIGALFVAFLPKLEDKNLRQITTIFSVVTLAITLVLLSQFDLYNPSFQFQEYMAWAKPIGLNYSLGIDGISLPLLVLNALLTLIAIYTIKFGRRVEANYWKSGETLEWTLSSPPPFHQFETLPRMR